MTTLKNTLHDSNNGLDYTLVNDHYLPNLTAAAPTEQHPTGRWGRLHKRYLKEHHPILDVVLDDLPINLYGALWFRSRSFPFRRRSRFFPQRRGREKDRNGIGI